MKKTVLALLVIVFLASCTANQSARQFGGTETIDLDKGIRLVNVTWKGKEGTDLWLLTKKDTTAPTSYSFKEKSNFGIWNGEIIINEK